MSQIPKISQVPIIEPMYTNGIMNPVWIRFFEKLASLANTDEVADSLTLMQLANQLPTQAITGQMLADSQNVSIPIVAIASIQKENIPTVAISQSEPELMPVTTLSTEIITYVTIPQSV